MGWWVGGRVWDGVLSGPSSWEVTNLRLRTTHAEQDLNRFARADMMTQRKRKETRRSNGSHRVMACDFRQAEANRNVATSQGAHRCLKLHRGFMEQRRTCCASAAVPWRICQVNCAAITV